jgi:hypothetical protein
MAAAFPIAEYFTDLKDWINKTVVHFTQGNAKVRTKRDRKLADLRRRGLIPEEVKPEEEKEEEEKSVAEKKNFKRDATEAEKDTIAPKTLRELEVEAAKEAYFIQSDKTVLKYHPAVTLKRSADEVLEFIRIETTPVELNGPIGYGYCKIEPGGSLHEMVTKLVDEPRFESFILLCIVCSCAVLAYEGAGLPEDNPLAGYFFLFNLILMVIFVLECGIRIIAKGFLFTNTAYLRDPWNQLDFTVVVLDVLVTVFSSLGLATGNFRALRSFRALRPLRTLKRAPDLKAVVELCAYCIPVIINLSLCTAVFYGVFGVMSMFMFAGRFWRYALRNRLSNS